jgi:glucan 1,3-beta-glucosidase
MDTLPLSVAREVRSVAWRQAWMAANEMANFPFDAAADKAAVIEHFEALKLEVSRLSLALSDDVLTDIRLLALNASWYAAYERQGRVAAAAQAKAEFENLALALSLAKDEMSERLADEIKWTCWNASWHASNSRSGKARDAASDLKGFRRHSRAMSEAPYRGVSLGGWLLLERWQCGTVFAGTTPSAAPDEWSLSRVLGPAEACRRIKKWRSEWITKDDFASIKALGFNTVRVPFGWWIVDGVEDAVDTGPFVTGGVSHLDDAVSWAQEVGLRVYLDLHSGVGFQSGHHATGRENADWKPDDWDMHATVEVLSMVAERFRNSPCVCGIGVINEPSNEVPISSLIDFYRKAYAAIRSAGMSCEAVDVIFPVYQRNLVDFTSLGFPDASMDRAVLDLHLYQCFGDGWTQLSLQQHLTRAADGTGHWPGIYEVTDAGHLASVSEWSLRLPDWDPSFGMYAEWSKMSDAERGEALFEYGARQMRQYSAGVGWWFWCWKVDVATEPWWSIQECVDRGWLKPGLWQQFEGAKGDRRRGGQGPQRPEKKRSWFFW